MDSIQFGYRVAFDGDGAGYLPDTGGIVDGGIQTDAGRGVELRSRLSRVRELRPSAAMAKRALTYRPSLKSAITPAPWRASNLTAAGAKNRIASNSRTRWKSAFLRLRFSTMKPNGSSPVSRWA